MPALPYYVYDLFSSKSELNAEVNKRGYRLRDDEEIVRGDGGLASVLEVIDLEEQLEAIFG